MPRLEVERQELFAQNRGAKGMIQIAAYRAAGYVGKSSHASKLEKNPKVAARIAEIRADTLQLTGDHKTARADADAVNYRDPDKNLILFRQEILKSLDSARLDGDHREATRCLEMFGVSIGVLKPKMDRNREPYSAGAKRPPGRMPGSKMINGVLVAPPDQTPDTQPEATEAPPTQAGQDDAHARDEADLSQIHRLAERLRSDFGDVPEATEAGAGSDDADLDPVDRD